MVETYQEKLHLSRALAIGKKRESRTVWRPGGIGFAACVMVTASPGNRYTQRRIRLGDVSDKEFLPAFLARSGDRVDKALSIRAYSRLWDRLDRRGAALNLRDPGSQGMISRSRVERLRSSGLRRYKGKQGQGQHES